MRLGFDLDEVVVDLTTEMIKHIEINYGIDWTIDDFSEYDFTNCKFDEDEETNARITEDMLNVANDAEIQFQAKPIEGARETLQKFKRAGHKLYFITSRPIPNQPLTYKWLRQNDIPFDGLKVIGQKDIKGFYGMQLKLDMYVDDAAPHLLSMWKYKKRWRKGLLLFERPWNLKYMDSSRFTKVKNWQEILRHVGITNRYN